MTIAAQPFDYTFDPAHPALIVIDMQRDFIEPGGFGAALGNDVRLLKRDRADGRPAARRLPQRRPADHPHRANATSPTCRTARRPSARAASPSLRIGDPGPMGRILIAGEPGADIVPELAPRRARS